MTPTEKAAWIGQVFQGLDWLIPAFQSVGFIETLARAIDLSVEDQKLEVLRETMTAIYSPQYLATMYLERYSQVAHMRDFSRQIDECFRAYYSGLKIVAVSSMIPVLEGIIRKIATAAGRDVGHGTQGLIREFEALVEEEKSSTARYEERVIMFELFLDFLKRRFLQNTDRYDGIQNFNRHGILHGVFQDFGEDLNFLRIIMLLDMLLLTMIYRGLARVSIFLPSDTADSRALAVKYLGLQQPLSPEPTSRASIVMKLYARIAQSMMMSENPPEFLKALLNRK